jgi:hypothetical protein
MSCVTSVDVARNFLSGPSQHAVQNFFFSPYTRTTVRCSFLGDNAYELRGVARYNNEDEEEDHDSADDVGRGAGWRAAFCRNDWRDALRVNYELEDRAIQGYRRILATAGGPPFLQYPLPRIDRHSGLNSVNTLYLNTDWLVSMHPLPHCHFVNSRTGAAGTRAGFRGIVHDFSFFSTLNGGIRVVRFALDRRYGVYLVIVLPTLIDEEEAKEEREEEEEGEGAEIQPQYGPQICTTPLTLYRTWRYWWRRHRPLMPPCRPCQPHRARGGRLLFPPAPAVAVTTWPRAVQWLLNNLSMVNRPYPLQGGSPDGRMRIQLPVLDARYHDDEYAGGIMAATAPSHSTLSYAGFQMNEAGTGLRAQVLSTWEEADDDDDDECRLKPHQPPQPPKAQQPQGQRPLQLTYFVGDVDIASGPNRRAGPTRSPRFQDLLQWCRDHSSLKTTFHLDSSFLYVVCKDREILGIGACINPP